MKKLNKLIKNPGIFFRDYFVKKYPYINNEQQIIELDEPFIIQSSLARANKEKKFYRNPLSIDVVYTWVNNKDFQWQSKYKSVAQNQKNYALYSNDEARFSNHNELYYSLLSVEKYLPWVRKIYIVTDNQTPSWFDSEEHPKVEIIDHTQIIDSKFLPTFNSHVIEAHLHNIPGLSERFIYINDDIFIARPLPAEHFFHPNGIQSIFISEKRLSIMQQKGTDTPTLHASKNCLNLLSRNYKKYCIDHPLVHTYVPLTKSGYQIAWKYYQKEIISFLNNKLRSNYDLNLATFLVPWLTYFEGKATPVEEVCYYFNIRSANAPMQYTKLLNKKHTQAAPHSFCANDFNSDKQIENYQQQLITMLKNYYSFSETGNKK